MYTDSVGFWLETSENIWLKLCYFSPRHYLETALV